MSWEIGLVILVMIAFMALDLAVLSGWAISSDEDDEEWPDWESSMESHLEDVREEDDEELWVDLLPDGHDWRFCTTLVDPQTPAKHRDDPLLKHQVALEQHRQLGEYRTRPLEALYEESLHDEEAEDTNDSDGRPRDEPTDE